MCYFCTCPPWKHADGCPLGGTGGSLTVPSTNPALPRIGSWECHRCKRVNAPGVTQCECGPDDVLRYEVDESLPPDCIRVGHLLIKVKAEPGGTLTTGAAEPS